jgi:hypothetical protein
LTPIEIFEYKKRWQPNAYVVRLHSDLRSQGKEFCKVQMFRHQWNISEYTDVYEDTFLFEHKIDADSFAAQWPKFVNQNES